MNRMLITQISQGPSLAVKLHSLLAYDRRLFFLVNLRETSAFALASVVGNNKAIRAEEAIRVLDGIEEAASNGFDPAIALQVAFEPQDNCIFIYDKETLTDWTDVLSDANGS